MSNENSTCSYTANTSVCSKLIWMNNSKIRLKFKGSCSKQEDKAAFTQKNLINVFIVYELDAWSWDLGTDFTLKAAFTPQKWGKFIVYELDTWSWDLDTDFTLKDCLFGSVKQTKNADTDK